MSKIREAFAQKKAFAGFLTAGDPTLEKTEAYITETERAGASLIEIGIPFSDPIAEGPIIQEANLRALSALGGCNTDMVFDMAARVRPNISVPLVFRTYLNPVFSYGYEAFCKRCKEAGVDGLVIPDMPYEERGTLDGIAKKYGVDIITLLVPTSRERIRMLAKDAAGYICLIPSARAADAGSGIITDAAEMAAQIRRVSDVPIAVRLETETPGEAKKYSEIADGVIAGNTIVKLIADHGENADGAIYEYVKSMVDAI